MKQLELNVCVGVMVTDSHLVVIYANLSPSCVQPDSFVVDYFCFYWEAAKWDLRKQIGGLALREEIVNKRANQWENSTNEKESIIFVVGIPAYIYILKGAISGFICSMLLHTFTAPHILTFLRLQTSFHECSWPKTENLSYSSCRKSVECTRNGQQEKSLAVGWSYIRRRSVFDKMKTCNIHSCLLCFSWKHCVEWRQNLFKNRTTLFSCTISQTTRMHKHTFRHTRTQ